METNPYVLAGIAGVATPDTKTSMGASFLVRVAEDVADRLADDPAPTYPEDLASEIADSAVPIYTREVWGVFTDLAAWQDDDLLSDFGFELGSGGRSGEGSMEDAACVILYGIAERLARSLIEEAIEDAQSDEED